MTCITYKYPYLVSEGRILSDNNIVSDNTLKIFHLTNNNWLIGIAGDLDHFDTIISLFNKRKTTFPNRKQLLALETDIEVLVIKPDKSIWEVSVSKENANYLEIKNSFYAIGGGAEYAMGAMAHGASALEAVKIAIKFNNSCGGEPQVFNVRDYFD